MRIAVAAGGSGGHVFPALAVLEELHQEGGHTLAWIGRPTGLEAKLAGERPWLTFFPLSTSGLPRDRPWVWPLSFLRNGKAFFCALKFMRRFRPQVLLAMGGYPAVAPVLAAKALGIPVAIHEQNAVMGLANRFLARFSDRVLLAFPNTLGCPPTAKVVVTGTPVRSAFLRLPPGLGEELLVLGGSLGSRKLVELLLAAGPKLAALPQLRVRLVVGRAGDPAELAQALRKQGLAVQVHPFTERVEELVARARLVLARAGGSTVAELACAGRPAILLPWEASPANHQRKNAEFLASLGGFLFLPEKDVDADLLGDLIVKLWKDEEALRKLGEAARAHARLDATKRVVEVLKSLGKGGS